MKKALIVVFVLALCLCGCVGEKYKTHAKEYVDTKIRDGWVYKTGTCTEEGGHYRVFVELNIPGRKPWEYGDNFTCGYLWFDKEGNFMWSDISDQWVLDKKGR